MSRPELKLYRPANGSEGDWFMAQFCERCKLDAAARRGDYANGCDILCRSLAFGIDHELYPNEWRYSESGDPTCTAFLDEGDADDPPPPEPDPRQLVLLADPTEDAAAFAQPLPELATADSL